MTALNDHLIKLIKLHGPLSISNYMTEALTNPKYGYYTKQIPFGEKGDFVTAPEVSQMFGELIGLWFADIWLKMKKPRTVHLIELGPGNGTLMADFLRVLKVLPEFLDTINLHFVETSKQLIEIQKEKLKEFPNNKTWHETVKSALSATNDEDGVEVTFIIANEFFDALPIRQFQKEELGWHERMVTVGESGKNLEIMLSPFPVHDVKLNENLVNAEQHSIIEVSPMTDFVVFEICKHFQKNKGAALFIDYGYDEHSTGETLQAVKKHNYQGIFELPGEADLSSHVNFKRIHDIVVECGLTPYGPAHQRQFLSAMGIEERTKTLLKEATPEQTQDMISALKRLISPDEMGTLFKVLGILSMENIEIAGF